MYAIFEQKHWVNCPDLQVDMEERVVFFRFIYLKLLLIQKLSYNWNIVLLSLKSRPSHSRSPCTLRCTLKLCLHSDLLWCIQMSWLLIYKTVCRILTQSFCVHKSQKWHAPKNILIYKIVCTPPRNFMNHNAWGSLHRWIRFIFALYTCTFYHKRSMKSTLWRLVHVNQLLPAVICSSCSLFSLSLRSLLCTSGQMGPVLSQTSVSLNLSEPCFSHR